MELMAYFKQIKTDYVKVTMHYNKHSYVYYIQFLTI